MDAEELVTSMHGFGFWKTIAINALKVMRPFIKMSGEQSQAWDIVVGLVEQA